MQREDIMVIVGGVIPKQDYDTLFEGELIKQSDDNIKIGI